jgi:hypothetical protein
MRHLRILALVAVVDGIQGAPSAQIGASRQPGFRVRSDFSVSLNADQGWAAPLNTDVTIQADQPFRLRIEVEGESQVAGRQEFRLQYRRNEGDWTSIEAHDFPKPDTDDAKTPRVSIVSCAAYKHGEPTSNLLAGSAAGFSAGTGVALADRTASWSGGGAHGEFEWALVVRRYADGAVTNDEGDRFEFRMVDGNGVSAGPSRHPVLRLAIPPGHVGGTFVETPGRIGPWRASNGDLYFIMEPAETSNLFMMVKSTDNGRTWREVDGTNRPPIRDLEAVDARQVGDTIHILHEVSRSARYHSFRTSEHRARPDSWDVRGELVADVAPVAQAAALEVRSDGSLVAFYAGPTRIHYSIRSPAGGWSKERIIDAGVPPNLAGPQAVRGANDTVHLAYYGTDGTIWYRRLLPDGTLTAREQIATGAGASRAEVGNVLGSWIRGNVYSRQDGTKVHGYVYDAGSNGGAGMNRFGEVVLTGR